MSENAKQEERDVRASLQHAVAQVCLEEEMSEDGASSASSNMSTQAVDALTELVYQYATCSLSNDLLAFSRHANRRTITLDDVLLVARKDPKGLQAKLQAFAETEKLSTTTASRKAKKKKAADTGTSQQLTQRMLELQERLKRGIDSSATETDDDDAEDSDSNVEVVGKPQTGESAALALNVDDSDDSVEALLGMGR